MWFIVVFHNVAQNNMDCLICVKYYVLFVTLVHASLSVTKYF